MSRAVSTAIRADLEALSSPHALLAFVTITHAALTVPLRVVSDVMDYVCGGDLYTGMPFDYRLLTDEDQAPSTELRMQNVDRRIGQALLAVNTRAGLRLDLRTSADFDLSQDPRAEIGTASSIYAIAHFEMTDVRVNPVEITARVILRDYAQEPWPGTRATETRFPGLFR